MRESYPLQWPADWPRATRPARSSFKATGFARARDRVLRQVKLLGGTRTVITSDLPTRLDGLPYAAAREPADRGIAVYWVERGRERVMACDRWDRVADNLHAIDLSLDALRGLSRWGTSSIVERAFAGFAALPPGPAEGWRGVMGFTAGPVPLSELKARYRELALRAHPDRGGDPRLMQKLSEAYETACRELGER